MLAGTPLLVLSLLSSTILAAPAPAPAPYDALVSSTESTEFGAYVNPNPKNICAGEELETLTTCASEVLSKLDECKPDDLACECCALQSMKRDCYGLCPNTASGNFLAVLYDDCETMNDINACNLPFKKHDAHVAKFLRPNARVPVEEKEPDFVIKSVLENSTSAESDSSVSGFLDHKVELEDLEEEEEEEEESESKLDGSKGSLLNSTDILNATESQGNSTSSQEANSASASVAVNTFGAFMASIFAVFVAVAFL